MAKYEEKFIVINYKRFEELNSECPQGTLGLTPNQAVLDLQKALDEFKRVYEANIGPLDQKYYVCNQDELYAPKIIEMILDGETAKGK